VTAGIVISIASAVATARPGALRLWRLHRARVRGRL